MRLMATLPPSSLQLPKPSSALPSSARQNPRPRYTSILRATAEEDPPPTEPKPGKEGDSFEKRLYQVRLRNRSGTGKKAELRKSKKGKKIGSGSGSGSKSSIFPASGSTERSFVGRVECGVRVQLLCGAYPRSACHSWIRFSAIGGVGNWTGSDKLSFTSYYFHSVVFRRCGFCSNKLQHS